MRRVVERAPDGRLLQSDVVGRLAGVDAQTAVVDTRSGLTEVPIALVTAARVVPPSTADELSLEAVAGRALRPVDVTDLDGWTLRADAGFTRRANSVLPLRQLRIPLDEALGTASAWYAERGLPLQLQVPTEARRLLDAELGERGWAFHAETRVYAADLASLRAGADDADVDAGPTVAITEEPDDGWLALYRGGAGQAAPARALLTRHDTVAFASVRLDGQVVAVARGTVDPDPGGAWLGVMAVEVDPHYRRQGLAARVTAELWRWGARHGAQRSYLSVLAANTAATALYEKLGYWHHHDYRYRSEPAT